MIILISFGIVVGDYFPGSVRANTRHSPVILQCCPGLRPGLGNGWQHRIERAEINPRFTRAPIRISIKLPSEFVIRARTRAFSAAPRVRNAFSRG